MMKDPEIKLFGRKIVLPENGGECSGEEDEEEESDCDRCSESSGGKSDRGEKKNKNEAAEDEDKNPDATTEESELDENSNIPSNDEDTASANHPKDEADAKNGQTKTLKKPDKILPCPRCNSMDTKFCYYNNYNVNQPRHFCRSCQRYWTAGGTMRNVPVGAGRRKNKNSSLHCHHITITEALQAARIDPPNGFHQMKFKPEGAVLSFGQASPVCESVVPNSVVNHKSLATCQNGEKLDDGSTKNGPSQPAMQNMNSFSSPGPYIPGIPWPFPWNSPVPLPAVYPLPYCPAPYLNYGLPNGWNLPWLTVPPPAANQPITGTSSGSNSPLGKHTRNGELIKPTSNQESSIVIPKTLRIDDPEEAAKSSIWDTLGIKYGSISREGLFKALQPKGSEKKQVPAAASPMLQANPAALSRSISFRETA